MRFVVVTSLLLLLAGGWAHAAEDVVEDAAYRFRLRAPGPGWRVMDRDAIRGAAPDALAGVTNGAIWGVIIAEAVGDMDAEAYADLLLSNLALDDVDVERKAPFVAYGKPGYQFIATGSVSGVRMRFVNTSFRNGDFQFQVVVWAAAAQRAGFHEPVLQAVTILPGEVLGRRDVAPTPDADGVGWYVRDRAFVSAALGLRVEPSEGWRVAVGGELTEMAEDAEVGLVHAHPDAYMVLTAERAVDVDREALVAERMDEAGGDEVPEFVGAPIPLKHGGQTVVLRTYRLASMPDFEYAKGFLFHGDHVLELLFWYATAARTKVREPLEAAVRSIRLLSAEQRRAAEAAVPTMADPQNVVGVGFSLRRGVYRDFAHGLTVTKPDGVHWRAEAGPEAVARGENGVLFLWAPALDVRCLFMVEPAADYTDRSLHAAWLEGAFGLEPEAAQRGGEATLWGGLRALHTEADQPDPLVDERVRILTTIHGGRAHQLYAWGTRRNMRDAKAALDALVAGVRFAAELPPLVKQIGGIEDRRLGMAVAPGALWTYRDATPPELASIGVVHLWQHRGTSVMAMGLCAMQEGQDAAWFLDLVTSIVEPAMGRGLGRGGGEAVRSAAELGGIPGERLTWPVGRDANEACIVARDRSFYMLAIFGKDGVPAAERERLRTTWRFLD